MESQTTRQNNFYPMAKRVKKTVNHFIESDNSDSFLIRVNGYSMGNANITHGDLLLCTRYEKGRSPSPEDGQIVVCLLNACPLVKRLRTMSSGWELHSENDFYSPLLLASQDKIEIIGLVRYVIKPA